MKRKSLPRLILQLLIIIISASSVLALLKGGYFTMHDDQDIARLFLLHEGIMQGSLYPRWVGLLGFGYGYPLFNFYPPLIYYVSEVFHLLGFALVTSVKLMLITATLIGTYGAYLLGLHLWGSKKTAFLSSVLFTFFTYRAVVLFVRGAFAEYFAMSLLPLFFLSLLQLHKNPSIRSVLLFGILLGLLVLAHPLIAFPSLIFIVLIWLYYVTLYSKHRIRYTLAGISGGLLGLGLSAFFWVPSLLERSATITDSILLKELADYSLHFVYPKQFWYSPWGFGGSIQGPEDGMSFALSRMYIILTGSSIILALLSYKKLGKRIPIKKYAFFLFLLIFSLFMATFYSRPVWEHISFLAYLQFPWRFLSFTAVLISVVASSVIFFLEKILSELWRSEPRGFGRAFGQYIMIFFTLVLGITIIAVNIKYLSPQTHTYPTDAERTSNEEISWRISKTSFEFVPKGVITKLTKYGTTTLDIDYDNLPKEIATIINGEGSYITKVDLFNEKSLLIDAYTPLTIRFNTYNFPGWTLFVNGREKTIDDNNNFKLITTNIDRGEHFVELRFQNTYPRTFGNILSLTSFSLIIYLLVRSKKST